MNRRLLFRLLLSLGLLLGQAMAIAHATQHDLLADGHAPCQECAVASTVGGDFAPDALVVAAAYAAPIESPVPEPLQLEPTLSRPHGTGPPRILV